jgi:hypothetical protein
MRFVGIEALKGVIYVPSFLKGPNHYDRNDEPIAALLIYSKF